MTLRAFIGKLHRNGFSLALLAVVAGGFAWPVAGLHLRRLPVLDAGIFLVFVSTGLTLEIGVVRRQLHCWYCPAAALASCLLVFPLLAFWPPRLLWPASSGLTAGTYLMAAAPVTLASGTILTALAGGNVSLSILICVATNLAAVVTMPVTLGVLLQTAGPIHMPTLAILRSLTLIMLLPTVVGMVLRPRLKPGLEAWQRPMRLFNQAVVLMIVFNAVSSAGLQVRITLGELAAVVLVMMFLHAVMLGVNFTLARGIRLDWADTAAFTLHTSQKALMVAFVVWSGFLADRYPTAMIPAVVCHVGQLVADTWVARWFWSRRAVAPAVHRR